MATAGWLDRDICHPKPGGSNQSFTPRSQTPNTPTCSVFEIAALFMSPFLLLPIPGSSSHSRQKNSAGTALLPRSFFRNMEKAASAKNFGECLCQKPRGSACAECPHSHHRSRAQTGSHHPSFGD